MFNASSLEGLLGLNIDRILLPAKVRTEEVLAAASCILISISTKVPKLLLEFDDQLHL